MVITLMRVIKFFVCEWLTLKSPSILSASAVSTRVSRRGCSTLARESRTWNEPGSLINSVIITLMRVIKFLFVGWLTLKSPLILSASAIATRASRRGCSTLARGSSRTWNEQGSLINSVVITLERVIKFLFVGWLTLKSPSILSASAISTRAS